MSNELNNTVGSDSLQTLKIACLFAVESDSLQTLKIACLFAVESGCRNLFVYMVLKERKSEGVKENEGVKGCRNRFSHGSEGLNE